MESTDTSFVKLKLLRSILGYLPPKSILQIDGGAWESYQMFGTHLGNILQFQINRPDDDYNIFILLDDKCIEWFKHYLDEMIADLNQEFDGIYHYRIYNYEMTDIFFLVFDIDMICVSKKLNFDKAYIKQWEKYIDIYFSLADRIPYTTNILSSTPIITEVVKKQHSLYGLPFSIKSLVKRWQSRSFFSLFHKEY